MDFKKLLKQFSSFFSFLFSNKFAGFNFYLMLLALLFFPNHGYYQTAHSSWQEPQIIKSQFLIPPPALYPKNVTSAPNPELTARSVVVMDSLSSVKLYEKNAHSHVYPASTTKMMTALVAMESFSPAQVLTVPKLIDEGQDIKLAEGEQMTVENLLYGLLVASANDAAETLAANYPGGREAFIQAMNKKAEKIYLKDTHFVNPTGIDAPGMYSSAFDLALIARYALYNPQFAKIVSTNAVTLTSLDGLRVHPISNINQLLGKIDGVNGVKTGWTDNAGECLVTSVERNGKKVIIVVLGSQDRFGETEKLIDWVYTNFEWGNPGFGFLP